MDWNPMGNSGKIHVWRSGTEKVILNLVWEDTGEEALKPEVLLPARSLGMMIWEKIGIAWAGYCINSKREGRVEKPCFVC